MPQKSKPSTAQLRRRDERIAALARAITRYITTTTKKEA